LGWGGDGDNSAKNCGEWGEDGEQYGGDREGMGMGQTLRGGVGMGTISIPMQVSKLN